MTWSCETAGADPGQLSGIWHEKFILKSVERLQGILGNVLQLTDLFIQLRNVVFDDVSQFLNLHRFVIKDSFPLAEESQFLQLSVSVGNVLADTFCDVDKVRFLLDGPGAPHGSIDLTATESLQRRPELRSPVSATVRHRTETQPVTEPPQQL